MQKRTLIKRWLDHKHLNQKELAKKMGVSPSFVSYYVNKEKIKYRHITAERFAKAFDLEYNEFMMGPVDHAPERTVDETITADMKNNMQLRIINIIMSSNDDDLKFYHNFLTRLIKPEEE